MEEMGDYYNYEIEDLKIVDINSLQFSLVSGLETPSVSRKIRGSISKPQDSKFQRFIKFIYDKEQKTTCNRSGKHWGTLLFYYSSFLSLLTILFLCYLHGMFRVLNIKKHPSPTLAKITTLPNPTFAFLPIRAKTLVEPMIWFNSAVNSTNAKESFDPYVKEIKQFYQKQQFRCASLKEKDCGTLPKLFGPCGIKPYGYNERKPCIILKLNSIDNWSPVAYNSEARIQKHIPPELKKNLDVTKETVCMYCQGKNSFDKDNIGELAYYPGQCFKEDFFPYGEGPIHVNAAIALQLKQPKVGIVITIRCQLFGLYIDGKGSYDQTLFLYIEK